METALFDYELPARRIAQTPLTGRDASLLLHVDREGGITDHRFSELATLLRRGDLLVVNDTRVRRARMHGTTADGAEVEVLVLERAGDADYRCLTRPARRLVVGTGLMFSDSLSAEVLPLQDARDGERLLRFTAADGDVDACIEAVGETPLPLYIHRRLDDPSRYQTMFATGSPVSAAAPTAGLHFTDDVLDSLHSAGVDVRAVRLDVGLATFAPIRTETVDDHPMHAERYSIPADTAAAIARARARGRRVVAVGTTVMRALESAADDSGRVRTESASTSLFIRPGHRFRIADALLTNFHQPRSSLLVLLAAFIGMQRWRDAYAHALQRDYRFLSFGDCMLCWRAE